MKKKKSLKKRIPLLALSVLLAAGSLFTGCKSPGSSSSGNSPSSSETQGASSGGASAEQTTSNPYGEPTPGDLSNVTYSKARKNYSRTYWNLDTIITITVYTEEEAYVLNGDGCGNLLDHYENLLSRTIETSEVSLLNTRQITEVSDDTAELLEKGLYYSELSGGRYDIAIASVTSVWDFRADEPVVPDAADLEEGVKWVDYQAVHLDGNEVTFDNEKTGIDLGSIAKGYIGEKLREYLVSQGVKSAILNLGGNLIFIGSKPDGSDFSMGIQQPFGYTGLEYFGIIRGSDISIVTSGVYERYFKGADGKYYHHILDPETGYSIRNNLYSVTIVGPCSTDCDALSTTLFSLGVEDGLELINSIDGYYAVFYTNTGEIILSDGIEEAYGFEEVEHDHYTFDTAVLQ